MKFTHPDLLAKTRKELLAKRDPTHPMVTICGGTGCRACACEPVAEAFKKELEAQGLARKVDLKLTGCHGFCERGPLVVIWPQGIFYQRSTPADVPEIVRETLVKGNLVERLTYQDPVTGKKIPKEADVPFYQKQTRIIFENNAKLDPTSLEDYIALGGYSALAKVLTKMKPEQVIEEVKTSGLRGRGGAGFPTGKKWETCRNAKGDYRFLICNADEGDPGAYMDRSVLEGNPHAVIEGMIIGAYAIGANEGVVYVRTEYPLAVKHLEIALDQDRKAGFLGKNILGTKFSFDIWISKGAGAFVSGEETALIASVESRRGEPRQRPPYPAVRGLWGKPTNINNVETWATVPFIISKGADWFSKIGTETSKGTKIFSLVGKINNTGLVEVPMGITLKEIVYGIGGGIPKGKAFKAVQTGGPSGGCIPAELLDLPIDFEKLKSAGSMMGSGGMIVMDENTCMVDVAKYFLNFLRDESCGKCMSCREGTQRMWELVTGIAEGRGKPEDLALLEELALAVKDASMCGLGQTAANPVLSTLRYFRDEYLAHIEKKKCPAGVCKALIRYKILADKCTGCLACIAVCPSGAITGKRKEVHVLDQAKCTKCGSCFDICKYQAILIE